MNKNPATLADEADVAFRAALALVRLIPSEVPLSVRPATDDDGAVSVAGGVVATFVGSPSAELAVVVDQSVDLALEGASGTTVSLADALRPAVEAATQTLGTGVLSDVRVGTAADAGLFTADDAHVFVLEVAGAVHGWFGLRLRAAAQPTPKAAPKKDSDSMSNMRVLYDVEMTLTAEIGRARLPVRQVLDLAPGAVIELDRVAGSPADLMVNGRLIARGEVVVIDEDYGLRITEIVEQGEASA